jgi:hypothetical protein
MRIVWSILVTGWLIGSALDGRVFFLGACLMATAGLAWRAGR